MKSEAIKIIGVLAASFPSAKISEKTVDAYATQLSDLPTELLDAAARQCAADCKFFPTMTELRNQVHTLISPARTTPADAWGEVMTAMKSVGFYGQPHFDDPIIERIVFAMDWQALCSSENTIADRAHFMKMYEQMVEREKSETKLLPGTVAMREQITNGRRTRLLQSSTDEEVQRRSPDGV